MISQFKSKRLLVSSVLSSDDFIEDCVIDLLTDKATKYLPPNWQGINSASLAKKWMQERIDEGGVYSLSLRENGKKKFVGFLFLHNQQCTGELPKIRIGYIISEEFWGLGLVSELIGAVIDLHKESKTISSLVAGVSNSNIPSVKVLTKNGFVYYESSNNTDFYVYKF